MSGPIRPDPLRTVTHNLTSKHLREVERWSPPSHQRQRTCPEQVEGQLDLLAMTEQEA